MERGTLFFLYYQIVVVTFLGWSKAGLNQLYLLPPILESRDYRFKLKVKDVLESGTLLLFAALFCFSNSWGGTTISSFLDTGPEQVIAVLRNEMFVPGHSLG